MAPVLELGIYSTPPALPEKSSGQNSESRYHNQDESERHDATYIDYIRTVQYGGRYKPDS